MSTSEVQIDVALVERLIVEQFPQWAHLPVTFVAPNGWDNRTFRLGEAMSVRLPSAERYAAKVAKEQHWLPELAPHLPLSIPTPLALGEPANGYPWRWSVYRWIEGENAEVGHIHDMQQFAISLAEFLRALQSIDPIGGPTPGKHNFFRGGSPRVYDGEARQAIAALDNEIDAKAATQVWEAALSAAWTGDPVWVHGDVSAANLLVDRGRLCAVIDFGGCCVGDPACDLTIAWTLFHGESR